MPAAADLDLRRTHQHSRRRRQRAGVRGNDPALQPLEAPSPSAKRLPDTPLPAPSAGPHRNPRKGACFMETASYLAGERWSDHPTCTHPPLGSLALLVINAQPDWERSQLLSLIPDVVGLTGDDPLIDMAIATSAPVAALPVGSAPSQSRRDATFFLQRVRRPQRPGGTDRGSRSGRTSTCGCRSLLSPSTGPASS